MTEVLTLDTEQSGVRLRTLSSEHDDVAFFFAVDEDREHLTQYGDKTGLIYTSLEAVANARLNARNRLRFGIWDDDRFVGAINASPDIVGGVEIGYWLRKSTVGYGYATFAVNALTGYLEERYGRVYAKVQFRNEKSMEVLHRAGYVAVNMSIEKWGFAIVYEARRNGTAL